MIIATSISDLFHYSIAYGTWASLYSNDTDKFWALIFHDHSLAVYHQFSSRLDVCFFFGKSKTYPSRQGNKAGKANSEACFTVEFDCVNFSCVKKEWMFAHSGKYLWYFLRFLTSITGSNAKDSLFCVCEQMETSQHFPAKLTVGLYDLVRLEVV